MSLFENIPDLASEDLTPAERTQGYIANSLLGLFNHARAIHANLQLLVWQNPTELTPQQVADVADVEATNLLAGMACLQTFVETFPLHEPMAVLQQWTPLADQKPADVTVTELPDGKVLIAKEGQVEP